MTIIVMSWFFQRELLFEDFEKRLLSEELNAGDELFADEKIDEREERRRIIPGERQKRQARPIGEREKREDKRRRGGKQLKITSEIVIRLILKVLDGTKYFFLQLRQVVKFFAIHSN